METHQCLECEAIIMDQSQSVCDQCLIFETYDVPMRRKTLREWREQQWHIS